MGLNLGSFAGGLADGYVRGSRAVSEFDRAKLEKDAKAAAMSVNQVESAAYTPEQGQHLEAIANAKDETGQPYYQVGHDGKSYTVGLAQGQKANSSTDIMAPSGQSIEANQAGAIGLASIEPKTSYSLAGKTQSTPFSQGEISHERLTRAAEVFALGGKPERAMEIMQVADARRKAAKEEETKAILSRIGDGGVETLTKVAPRIVSDFLKQGDIGKAKAFQEFADSSAGREYARLYTQGHHLASIGDYEAAAPVFSELYNKQYPDGRNIKLTSVGDGNYQVDMINQQTGEVVGSNVMPASELAKQAITGLSPISVVEHMVAQGAKRDAEAAVLDRQIKVEEIKNKGDEYREDRRDERLAKRLEATPDKGPTLAQKRANAEISLARKQISGLSPDEIRRRTAKTTDTGRDNPDYDPALARASALAARRKVGDDGEFDQRAGQQPQQDNGNVGSNISDRFKADPQMKGYALGKQSANGIEVMKDGKVVGHYR